MLYVLVALIAFVAGGVSFVGLLIWSSDEFHSPSVNISRRSPSS